MFQSGSSPNITLFPGAFTVNPNLAVGAWGSVAAVFNGASSSLKVDATAPTTGTTSGTPGGLTLGAQGSAVAAFGNIQVAEEIVYSVAHDAATQAAIIAYLNTL